MKKFKEFIRLANSMDYIDPIIKAEIARAATHTINKRIIVLSDALGMDRVTIMNELNKLK